MTTVPSSETWPPPGCAGADHVDDDVVLLATISLALASASFEGGAGRRRVLGRDDEQARSATPVRSWTNWVASADSEPGVA